MGKAILDIQDLKKSFALNFTGKTRRYGIEYRNVLDGLSFSIKRGEVTALVGGNGAGKTTLFNLVSGLLRPDTGSIWYFGSKKQLNCTGSSPWVISAAGIGRMFQGPRVFSECSIMDHLLLQSAPVIMEWPFYNLARPAKSRKRRSALEAKIIKELNTYESIDELLENPGRHAGSLSFAQQRLLSIAGLIVGNYELLLLDEPSSGLSNDSFGVLYKLVERMKDQGKSIFIIEHNMEVVRQMADHCYYLDEGRIKYSGSPREVLEKEEVLQSYLL